MATLYHDIVCFTEYCSNILQYIMLMLRMTTNSSVKAQGKNELERNGLEFGLSKRPFNFSRNCQEHFY